MNNGISNLPRHSVGYKGGNPALAYCQESVLSPLNYASFPKSFTTIWIGLFKTFLVCQVPSSVFKTLLRMTIMYTYFDKLNIWRKNICYRIRNINYKKNNNINCIFRWFPYKIINLQFISTFLSLLGSRCFK